MAAETTRTHATAGDIFRRLLSYTRPYWWLVAVAAACMAVEAVATAGFAALLQPIIDDGFTAQDPTVIAYLPWVIALIFVVRGASGFGGQVWMFSAGRGVVMDLRRELFQRYLTLPAGFFDSQSSGQLISRLTYNIEQVAEASTNAITVVVKDSLYVVLLLGVMLLQSVKLTLATLIIGPVIAVIVVYVSRRFRRLSRKIQETMGDVSHRAGEVIKGHREVKMYGGSDQERRLFGKINADNRLQFQKLIATKAASTALVQLSAGLALALIVFMAMRESMLQEVTAGRFTTFMTAMLGILPSLKRLTNVNAVIQRGVAAADSVFAVLDTQPEEDPGTRSIDRARGLLEVKEVSLTYPDASASALNQVTLTAKPGTVTAIVGRSGSGKTSLASAITRFYEPSSGQILLDGVPAREYRLQDYRRQVSLVSQHVILFDDTVANNIAYGSLSSASREQVENAARMANAMAFIDDLPQGMDTFIGENGIQLSGGQRQRLAIARAILKDAPVLILDEATSALDTESERAIQEALNTLAKTRTTLVIAHRLSTIEHADQVVVLDEGRVVECGSHVELLRSSGVYSALHNLQFVDARSA